MRISKEQIENIRSQIPTTHEIGGVFTVEKGEVVNVKINTGQKCRDKDGILLKGVTCHVHHEIGTHIFHTHPKANRPSSGDLKNAIVSFPTVQNNFVFTPLGVWWYKVSPSLHSEYNAMSKEEQRRFIKGLRFLGHMEQTKTQNNICDSFERILRQHGFLSKYIKYENIKNDLNFEN